MNKDGTFLIQDGKIINHDSNRKLSWTINNMVWFEDSWHAKTIKNNWICDTCYDYDVCLNNGADLPCESECNHRPNLISEFIKYGFEE